MGGETIQEGVEWDGLVTGTEKLAGGSKAVGEIGLEAPFKPRAGILSVRIDIAVEHGTGGGHTGRRFG